MGHLNAQTIQMLNNTANNGLEYSGMFSSCDICSAQKRKQVNHPKKANHDVDAPLALIFTDFIGPVSSPTIGGHRYVSKFADVFAKWKKVYLTTSISKAVETLRLFVQSLAIPMGLRVQRLRSDRGTEYNARHFNQYSLDTGIRQEFTSTHSPQQNGGSERDGRTLTEIARCLLSDGGFPKSLWGEMFVTAAFLVNKALHKALEMETPY